MNYTLSHVTFHASPALAEIVNNGHKKQIQETYHRLAILTVVLSIVAFWTMVILNKWFIYLWVGESFSAGQAVLVLALIIMLQQMMTRTGVLFLNAKGIARPVSFVGVAEAVVNLSISIGLGYLMGLPGILLGTILASIATTGWFIPRLLRLHLGISAKQFWIDAFLRPLLWLSVVGAGLYWAITYLYEQQIVSGWLGFFVSGIIVGGVLLGVSWFLFLRIILVEYIPQRFTSNFGVRKSYI